MRAALNAAGVFLLTTVAFPQENDTLATLCRKRDINALSEFIDSMAAAYDRGDRTYMAQIDRMRGREVIPGYSEQMFSWALSEYHVLSTATSIIAYRIKDWDGRIENWSDDAALSALDRRYRALYKVPLRFSEMFCDTIVYGVRCGKAPRPPKYRKLMEALVASADTTTLNRWITSPNAEMQLYALEALGRSRDEGCELSNEQRRLMDVVLQKKGTIHYCYGCKHWEREIQEYPFRKSP
jgi:hypothetical protein